MPQHTGLRLSVIIPTCNRADIVVENLRCLSRQSLPADQFEVLVCDDASDDDTFARLQAEQTPYALRLFRLEQRSGPGKARNLLINEARAEKLVILNDDALLVAAGLAIHEKVLEMTRGERLAVAGKFSFPQDFQQTLMGCLLEHTTLSFRYPLMEPHALYGAKGFYSCNLGIYKSAVVEAGYFDEGMAGTGAEDMELGDRLARRGHMAVYLDKCLAVHEHRLTIHDFCRAQIGRGAGGVLRTFNDHDLIFHYDAIDPDALDRLRRTLAAVEPDAARLTDLVHAMHLRARPDASIQDGTEIPWRDEPLRYSSKELWHMDAREIAGEFQQALREAMSLSLVKHLKPQALGRLFQICSLLKWYYDTVGVSRSPWIDAFAADASRRLAARQQGGPA
ncbi:glycosyltransferase family 2 protein [Solidesulfovibrio sp.]